MNLFERIFRPNKAKESEHALEKGVYFKELNGYYPVFTTWHGELYERELVRAAIDARARHISKLKIELRGNAQPQLQSKMRQGPNQWQTYSQFLYRLSTILDIHNTAFVVPVFDADMRITGYYPVLPKRCDIVDFKDDLWLRYKFSHGDTAAVELRKCAILNKFQYKDDFFGEKNDSLDETIKLMDIQDQNLEEGVKNAASYRFMAQVNNFTKADDLKNERVRFSQENLTKDAEAGGLLLFPNTYMNVQQIKNNNFEIDPEQTKLINDNVFKYFGVNDRIMKNEATGDELDAFFNGAIEPFAIQFSEALSKAMFSERERANGSYLIASADRLQYMTTKSKVEMAQQMLDRGVMSINEARELFNYPPVDGGDVRTIRGEYKSADEVEMLGGTDDASENE
jgi:HK97 family phage portal protein